MPDYIAAARRYYDAGYLAIPLGPDAAGRPKRPLDTGWTSVPNVWDRIAGLSWASAEGIGLVLGDVSDGLCALDVDDVPLAEHAHAVLSAQPEPPRMIWTIRHRLHVFLHPMVTPPSRRISVTWKGRICPVEIKATGTQVATVPTPGYAIAQRGEPFHLGADDLLRLIGVAEASVQLLTYPRPWRTDVPRDERNNTAYIEAHHLREAGAPLEFALEFMEWRFARAYDQTEITWDEVARTIESAYRKGSPPTGATMTDIDNWEVGID